MAVKSWKENLLGEVDVPADKEYAVRLRRRERFHNNSPIAALYGLLAAVILTIVYWGREELPVVAIWCCATGLMAGLRISESRKATIDDEESLKEFETDAVRHTLVGGGVWGVLIAALILVSTPDLDWVLGVTVASVLCVGAFLHSSFARASIGFSALIGAGTLLGLTLGNRPFVFEIGILMAGSALALQRFAASSYATEVRRQLASLDLKESNETVGLLLRDFEEHSSDWLWRVDHNGLVIRPSIRFIEATGLKEEELSGASFFAFFDVETSTDFQTQMAQGSPFRDLIVQANLPDGCAWWSLSGQPTSDGGFRGVCSDVTSHRLAEQKIAYFQEFDELTGLPNRAMLIQQLEEAAAVLETKPDETYALFCIDLDNFKSVNDTLGHPAGDAFLREVASRLDAATDTETTVARLGGDEFALFKRGCSKEEAEDILDLILDSMLAPVALDDDSVLASGSVGVAMGPQDGVDPAVLMKNAELALYRAKAQGRGCGRFFEQFMDEDARTRAELESGLRAALADDAMDVYFQPLVNTRTRKTMGYETLLRWNRPGHGLVSPAEFIACAEETGIIVPLGEWVIRKAIQEAAEWSDEVTVAVNLSPTQMQNPSLVSTVVSALAASQLDPARLEIEITETVLMNETDANLKTLHALKDIGVKIALDDFGTGFSSLSYLRAFPFDKLKIDQCFVRDIETSPENHAIVRSVITLARDLGMNVTAEGVENEQQATILAGLGCATVQGYLFSRPVPSCELEKKPREELAQKRIVPLIRKVS